MAGTHASFSSIMGNQILPGFVLGLSWWFTHTENMIPYFMELGLCCRCRRERLNTDAQDEYSVTHCNHVSVNGLNCIPHPHLSEVLC